MSVHQYQIFYQGSRLERNFTYLDTASNNYQKEKEILLSQGFELDVEPITAASPEEAIQKYTDKLEHELHGANSACHPFYSFALMLESALKSRKR
ncbi:hypothetical protein F7U70_000849 [Vibrio fluvialis]|uniref:hypothetical protein n=1 Tax=Vibrio fluvialis TaxID=676 RepID=UPI001F1F27FA|nr:hypothetical protein [Vibrio fluvialis]EKO3942009.1 hypothetical protein [Vibrio fluvialis]MCE7652717.1 hypothetical protein [Vibrio fluvialis]